MITKDDEYRLRFKRPISINGIPFKQWTYGEIIDFGSNEYNRLVSVLVFNFGELDESKQLTNYECMLATYLGNETDRFMLNDAFMAFFGEIPSIDSSSLYFGDEDEKTFFSEFEFNYLVELLKKIHGIKPTEKLTYANKETESFFTEMAEFEELMKKKNDDSVTFMSILENISYRKNSNLNILNVCDLTPYQVMRASANMGQSEHYDNNFLGIYTGNVDTKNFDVNSIDWRRNIEIK